MSCTLPPHCTTTEYVLRPAHHESIDGRRTGPHLEFIDEPYFTHKAITEEEYPDAVRDYLQIRTQLDSIISQFAVSGCGAMMTLCLLTATRRSADEFDYPDVPTVVIFSSNPAEVLELVRAVPTQVRIEVALGSCLLGTHPPGRHGSAHDPGNTSFHAKPPMGQSIGIAGDKNTGTLGCYVIGRTTGKIWGLTNGHVGLSAESSLALPVELFPSEVDARKRVVVQPSDEDRGEQLEYAKQRADWDQKSLAGEIDRRFRTRPEAAMESRMKFEKLATRDRKLGNVDYAHLGIVQNNGTDSAWLDVSAIKIDPDRVGEQPNNFNGGMVYVKGPGDPVAGMTVVKADGRTCGWNQGTLNGVLADCWMEVPAAGQDVTAMTREWIVMDSYLGRHAHTVSAPGDSGSFFVASGEDLNPARESFRYFVVGQMFGGALRTCSRDDPRDKHGFEFTVMTPAAPILERLSVVLGEELLFEEEWIDPRIGCLPVDFARVDSPVADVS